MQSGRIGNRSGCLIAIEGVHQADHIFFANLHRPGDAVMLRLTGRDPGAFSANKAGSGGVEGLGAAVNHHIRAGGDPAAKILFGGSIDN